jgi:hypothetical protein
MLATPQLSCVCTAKNTGDVQSLFVLFTVIFSGQTMLGDILSTTVTSDVQVPVFPLPSLAVKVTIFVPALLQLKLLGTKLCKLTVPQLSLPEANILEIGILALPKLERKTVAGWQLIIGRVTSFNVTKKVHIFELPLPSFAVKVTVCAALCPVNKVVASGLCDSVIVVAQLSLFDTKEYAPMALWQVAFALIVTLFGQTIVGSVTSFNVTEKVHIFELPLPSFAVNVIVWVALCPVNKVVASGLCDSVITVAQLSVFETKEYAPMAL